jgi:copper(I)-binding protein
MTATTRRNLLAVAALLAPISALAHADVRAGDLTISNPWTRAAGVNGNGGAFLAVRNAGAQPDRLISATTTAARRVELHTMIRDGDVMRMRPVNDIPVPAGQTVELRPGGLHVMLIGLNAAMQPGVDVPLTLRFERAGEVNLMLHVQPAGARTAPHQH